MSIIFKDCNTKNLRSPNFTMLDQTKITSLNKPQNHIEINKKTLPSKGNSMFQIIIVRVHMQFPWCRRTMKDFPKPTYILLNETGDQIYWCELWCLLVFLVLKILPSHPQSSIALFTRMPAWMNDLKSSWRQGTWWNWCQFDPSFDPLRIMWRLGILTTVYYNPNITW